MIIWTAKLRRGRLIAGALALCLVGGVIGALRAYPDSQAVSATILAPDPSDVEDEEDRRAYLGAYGWQLSPSDPMVEELLIPETFDETYTQYLDLQSQQGFDLAKYAGKRIKRYTYEITNYPTGEIGVQAGLLIYKDTVIGGEILSTDLGGFLHGLTLPDG